MNSLPEHISIRELQTLAELKASEVLQREVWGEDDPADNADILLAIKHEGGLVAGAFEAERLVGFVFGFPTRDPATQHSHRLAVHPDCRGLGLGLALKHYQRQWCLDHGIYLVRWTFDPALAANALLNIGRLGATSATYSENYYGPMAGINAGVPSDRLLAEWHLEAEHVKRLIDQHEHQRDRQPNDEYVSIPADFTTLLQQDLQRALEERLRIRRQLQALFASGYHIIDFDKNEKRYTLAKDKATLIL